MSFSWPIDRIRKEQHIKFTKATVPVLLPNKNYVLVRRFSSKDDKRRLIACPYFSKYLSSYNYIGIENHLNYIYKFLGELDELELLGISGLLNSTAFDIYFRTFNGNINVSAFDLKNIPFPKTLIIKKIGLLIKEKGLDKLSQTFIDEQVNSLLGIKI
jgi:adenine-specific DNA-methyltransferase